MDIIKNLLGLISLSCGIMALIVAFMGGDGTWLIDRCIQFAAFAVFWSLIGAIPTMIIVAIFRTFK